MMNVSDFVKSIYLGDRACKRILIDSWNHELSIEVDLISRIRSSEGAWNYYDAEDIKNGQLVFGKVRNVFFDENGNIPNDQINSFEAHNQEDGSYCFTLLIDSVADDGGNVEVELKIIAESVGIRNPLVPKAIIWD